MTTLAQDLRHAVRIVRHAPMFAAAAILTLALGIGASTTVVSAVDMILRRPPSWLADIVRIAPEEEGQTRQASRDEVSAWRAALGDVRIAAYSLDPVNVGGMQSGGAERLLAAAVDSHYFAVAQVAAVVGRAFGDEDDANVAVISDSMWRRRFDARPQVNGDLVHIDGVPHSVIGVLPEGHRPPLPPAESCSVRAWPSPSAGFSGRFCRT